MQCPIVKRHDNCTLGRIHAGADEQDEIGVANLLQIDYFLLEVD